VLEVKGAVKAVEAALKMLAPGDLLLLQADVIDETVDFVRGYLEKNLVGREVGVIKAFHAIPEPVAFAADSID